MSDILDLKPRIEARRMRDCAHRHVIVDLEVAELKCDDCGALMDPWKYLRDLAKNEQLERVHVQKMRVRMRQATEQYNKHIERLNAQIKHHTEHLNHLIDTKNRLQNEWHGDKTLGTIAARTRRRKVATGKPTPGS